ncbi:MAG: hypothetical protein KAY32_03465 [Candidatus Eisenbacteria sp.]|nr:hypothetical protein [Candidatus Eisenbacteria bacterium]
MRRHFFQMSGGAVASKILGALREISLAHFFGTGIVTDAYRAGLTATLSPAHLLTTQVVQTCFVPLYARDREADPRRAWALFQTLLVACLALGVVLGALLFFFAGPLVARLLPGFDPARQAMTAALLRIMACGVPFYLYTALLGALGAAQKDFLVPSLRPGLQNLGMIAMIVAGGLLQRPLLIAYGFTGTYALLALGATGLLWHRNRIPRRWALAPEILPHIGRALWPPLRPLLLVAALVEGNLLLERGLASLIGGGTVAAIDYARFVTESAHALLIIPLGLISLSHFATHDEATVRREATRLVTPVLFLFLPLSAFLAINGRELLALLFLRGAFDQHSLEMSTRALIGLGAGLWAFGASHLLRRIHNARLRNRRVLVAETTAVVLNVGLNLALYRSLGILALGIGSSVGALGAFLIYSRSLGLDWRAEIRRLRLLLLGLVSYVPLALLGRGAFAGLAAADERRGLAMLALQGLFAALYWGLWARVLRRRR